MYQPNFNILGSAKVSFLNIDGSKKFFREDNLRHSLNTPCKFGPPRSSHLQGDRFRTTGFSVHTSKGSPRSPLDNLIAMRMTRCLLDCTFSRRIFLLITFLSVVILSVVYRGYCREEDADRISALGREAGSSGETVPERYTPVRT